MMRAVLAVLITVALASGCLDPHPRERTVSPVPKSSATLVECAAESFRTADVNISIQTNKGAIRVLLHGSRSPLTVCNLLRYVEDDYYDNTVWHRVCKDFVIQAGGHRADGSYHAPRDPIENEGAQSKLRNFKRTIGMARESEPHSARANFYLNLKDNLHLDFDGPLAPGYAVFGDVTDGWSVVEQIAETLVQPTPPNLQNPSARPCNGKPVPSQETTIEDIAVIP